MCMAADEKMKALLRKHGARLTVETVTDLKTAQAILDGTVTAESLNLTAPTLKDLAEILLGGGGDPEFVRMCLPHITRKRDDPWWNGMLLNAKVPEGLKLILEHGVDPDMADDAGYTVLHHLASDYCRASNEEARVIRATMLLDAGASLAKRDPLLKSTPLGWACRWGRIELVDCTWSAAPTPWDQMPSRGRHLWHGLRSAGITRLSSCSARMAQVDLGDSRHPLFAWVYARCRKVGVWVYEFG